MRQQRLADQSKKDPIQAVLAGVPNVYWITAGAVFRNPRLENTARIDVNALTFCHHLICHLAFTLSAIQVAGSNHNCVASKQTSRGSFHEVFDALVCSTPARPRG